MKIRWEISSTDQNELVKCHNSVKDLKHTSSTQQIPRLNFCNTKQNLLRFCHDQECFTDRNEWQVIFISLYIIDYKGKFKHQNSLKYFIFFTQFLVKFYKTNFHADKSHAICLKILPRIVYDKVCRKSGYCLPFPWDLLLCSTPWSGSIANICHSISEMK